MDKVIKHRFWILLGLCLPLIIYGYMSASGAIKTATGAREDELEQTYNQIPSGSLPNDTYAAGMKDINSKYDVEVDLAQYEILQRQQQDMDWPASLAPLVPDTYRGEFTDRDAGFIYVDEYENLLQDAWRIAEPVTPDGNGFTGKVSFDYRALPRHEFRPDELSVSSERMWNAQEDIWFLRVLLAAVRELNAGAENIAKAPLRRIDTLTLVGGDGQFGTPAAGSGFSGGGGEMGDMYEEMADMYDDLGDMGDMSEDPFGMGGGVRADVSVKFDPSEEFGNAVAARTASPAGDSAEGAASFSPGAGGFRPGAANRREEIRYIALDENSPYRERGFYMSVLIHQRHIAEFLITLSNSKWPIRIVRFHVGPNPHGARPAMGGGTGEYAYDDQYSYGGNAEMDLGFVEGSYDYQDYESSYGGGTTYGGGVGPAYGPQQSVVNQAALKGAFSHPDLVQLEVLGAITLFNPLPEDVLARVNAALEQATGTDSAVVPADVPAAGAGATEAESPAVPESETNQPAPGENEPVADPDGSVDPPPI